MATLVLTPFQNWGYYADLGSLALYEQSKQQSTNECMTLHPPLKATGGEITQHAQDRIQSGI